MENCNEKIEKLEMELKILKDQCSGQKGKFKTGDWVCFNHGEYPNHFSRDVWQITHWAYDYDDPIPYGRQHQNSGHFEKDLRYAHPIEIEYMKSGLPFIYNKKEQKYEIVEISNGDFRIGNLINTENLRKLSAKEFLTFLLETNLLNDEGIDVFSCIFTNL